MENGLYAQLVMIRQRDSDNKRGKKRQRHIPSKDNHQDQDVGSILIMIGKKNI